MKKLLLCCLLVAGCKTGAYTIHHGAANAFDSQAYDSLYTTDHLIQGTKAALIAGTLPASAKPILNKVIQSYNTADAAYRAYHDIATAGGDTSALSATLGADLSQLAIDIASLSGVKK